MAQARARGKPKITGPESVKLLAYGKPTGRRPPEAARLLDWYRQMYLIRRFEEAAAEMYALGKIGGFLHLYIGEEAIAVGACAAMQPQDHLLTHYRDHGYALARGSDPGAVMAELFGRSTGVTRGMGGSMHLVDAERNFWGGHAIVGGHIVIAPGLALAAVMQGEKRVVVDVFGDGATAIGEFHEGVNFAATWNLPVIFLVENNLYGMGARAEEQFKVPEIFKRAQAYGITGRRIDGMDVVAVHRALSEAYERARSGGGPSIIEAITYRFRGHSMADAESYREKAEVRRWQRRDPIRILDERLVKGGLVARKELHEIQRRVELQVQDAVVFADNSPFPSIEQLYQNLYATPLPDRGGAVSGPQGLVPPALAAKAARLTEGAQTRSRRQPAMISLDVADAGGPGGRPAAAEPAARGRTRKSKGQGEGGETAQQGDRGQAQGSDETPEAEAHTPSMPASSTGAEPRKRSRSLPQPGRPGGGLD
ncbi:MAG: pyruvate dehydrogenase (acetyl-transferring) E1 component subunit alpha [Candidatus Dormibacteria bacterium]